jgi:hypothetical protein
VPNRKPQVGDLAGGRDEPALQGDGAEARCIEEPDAFAQQDGHEMDDDLIDQTGTKALGCQIGSEDDDRLAGG